MTDRTITGLVAPWAMLVSRPEATIPMRQYKLPHKVRCLAPTAIDKRRLYYRHMDVPSPDGCIVAFAEWNAVARDCAARCIHEGHKVIVRSGTTPAVPADARRFDGVPDWEMAMLPLSGTWEQHAPGWWRFVEATWEYHALSEKECRFGSMWVWNPIDWHFLGLEEVFPYPSIHWREDPDEEWPVLVPLAGWTHPVTKNEYPPLQLRHLRADYIWDQMRGSHIGGDWKQMLRAWWKIEHSDADWFASLTEGQEATPRGKPPLMPGTFISTPSGFWPLVSRTSVITKPCLGPDGVRHIRVPHFVREADVYVSPGITSGWWVDPDPGPWGSSPYPQFLIGVDPDGDEDDQGEEEVIEDCSLMGQKKPWAAGRAKEVQDDFYSYAEAWQDLCDRLTTPRGLPRNFDTATVQVLQLARDGIERARLATTSGPPTVVLDDGEMVVQGMNLDDIADDLCRVRQQWRAKVKTQPRAEDFASTVEKAATKALDMWAKAIEEARERLAIERIRSAYACRSDAKARRIYRRLALIALGLREAEANGWGRVLDPKTGEARVNYRAANRFGRWLQKRPKVRKLLRKLWPDISIPDRWCRASRPIGPEAEISVVEAILGALRALAIDDVRVVDASPTPEERDSEYDPQKGQGLASNARAEPGEDGSDTSGHPTFASWGCQDRWWFRVKGMSVGQM